MSADWHFDITLGERLDVESVVHFLDGARAVGLVPFMCEGEMSRVTSDGMDVVVDTSIADLVRSWARDGGAFEIESPDHYITLSSDGGTSLSMGVRRSQFEQPGREAAWKATNGVLAAALDHLPVVYVVGWEEDMIENLDMIGILAIGQPVVQHDEPLAADRSPSALGWLNLAPAGSELAHQLLTVAGTIGTPCTPRGRWVELRLSPTPWGDALQAVFDANRSWHAATGPGERQPGPDPPAAV